MTLEEHKARINATPRCDKLAQAHLKIGADSSSAGVMADWIALAQTLERDLRDLMEACEPPKAHVYTPEEIAAKAACARVEREHPAWISDWMPERDIPVLLRLVPHKNPIDGCSWGPVQVGYRSFDDFEDTEDWVIATPLGVTPVTKNVSGWMSLPDAQGSASNERVQAIFETEELVREIAMQLRPYEPISEEKVRELLDDIRQGIALYLKDRPAAHAPVVQQHTDLIKRLDECRKMIGNMCSEGRCPKMSIPCRPDVDEDVVICRTLKEAMVALGHDTVPKMGEQDRDNAKLRYMLAMAYGITYGDDGELQNSAEYPLIDFKRDPVDQIQAAIHDRSVKALIAAHASEVQRP